MIFSLLITITIIVFILSLLLYLKVKVKKYSFGRVSRNRIYEDSTKKPGKTLSSKLLPLVGKPDYLIQDKNLVIPVEVKMGKTPQTPRESHVLQLMAYCHLVEDNYNIRPPYGILKYPLKEFTISYTNHYEAKLHKIVNQMLHEATTGDINFNDGENLCRECKIKINESTN